MVSSPHPAQAGPAADVPHRVGGRYVLGDELGRGGMATVHRARDEVLDREVAVKLAHRHLAGDDAFLDRFRREARAAAALDHPNVVAVHDWGEDADGAFLVLQLVAGPSLRRVLRDRRHLTPGEAVAILVPAARGLGAAHDAGLVHRDVKPENLLLGLDGTVRVTDFGLARAVASATATFGTDMLVGSPHYLAPEAVRGEPLDPRADVYGLGVVLSEVLVGHPPFEGESPLATAVQHTSRRVPPPSQLVDGVPPGVDAVVRRATAPDPGDRYADARAFAAALEDAVPAQGATVAGVLASLTSSPVSETAGGTTRIPLESAETTVSARTDAPLWEDDDADAAELGAGGPALDPDDDEELPSDDEGWDAVDAGDGRRGRRWPLAVLLTVLLLAASAAGGYLVYDRLLAPVTDVPDVLRVSVEDASERLVAAGFEVAVAEDRPFDLEVPADHVLEQSPAGQARAGTTVTVTVSAGPRPVELPDVAGRDADDAEAVLQAAGVEVERERRFDDQVDEGRAIATEPAAGATVDEASTVTLVVSRGPRPVEVVDVRGRPLAEAEAALQDAGLQTEVVDRIFSSDVPEGAVVGQSPGSGEVPPGSTVELTVSDGPEPVEVPSVRGQPRDEAVAQLEALGFAVEVEERGGFGAFLNPGQVFDQDPGPGASRRPGDTVTVFAYRG